jgi:hypothetical protein
MSFLKPRRLHARRGSLLVAALLLFALLLTLGLGLMSAQSARMRAARAQSLAIQARSLALAGWEDVRTKLGKDLLFPMTVDSQDFFSYSEDVYDLDGRYEGSYVVLIDLRWQAYTRGTDGSHPDPLDPSYESQLFEHQSIYPITCVGKLATGRVGEVLAERELYFELDVKNWKVIRMEDRGSL